MYDWFSNRDALLGNLLRIRVTKGKVMYTLVVVDMQPGFDGALGSRVRANCLREIKQAMQDNAPIVFLEFNGYGDTMPELLDPVSNYENYHQYTKSVDDGGPEVRDAVVEHGLPKKFKVCGINTDCCVHATVRGLTNFFPMAMIEVIADACDSDLYHLSGLDRMKQMGGNVNVIFN